jgi:spore coat protein CotF
MIENIQNQQSQLGAHELLEMHEVLMDTVNSMNLLQLYIQHCRDTELRSILENQLRFMTNEYNLMVQLLKENGQGNNVTYRNRNEQTGLQGSIQEQSSRMDAQINERDIASGLLGCTKYAATLRMRASLECTVPSFRNMLVQAAKNSGDQAYELWFYMNKKNYYPVPTFPSQTAGELSNFYSPIPDINNDGMNSQ